MLQAHMYEILVRGIPGIFLKNSAEMILTDYRYFKNKFRTSFKIRQALMGSKENSTHYRFFSMELRKTF